MTPEKPARVREIPPERVCTWCLRGVRAPPRFNALIECGPNKVRASGVPGHFPRFTTRDGHVLAVAPPAMVEKGKRRGLVGRAAAALASAVHVFKAGG